MVIKQTGRRSGRTTRSLLRALLYASENPGTTVMFMAMNQQHCVLLNQRAKLFWQDHPIKFVSLRDTAYDRFRGMPSTTKIFKDHDDVVVQQPAPKTDQWEEAEEFMNE